MHNHMTVTPKSNAISKRKCDDTIKFFSFVAFLLKGNKKSTIFFKHCLQFAPTKRLIL